MEITPQRGKGSCMPGVIGDYYTAQNRILSTRSADAYTAIENATGKGVCLWVLRYPIAPESEGARRYLARIEAINTTHPPVSEILSSGIDSAGMAFCTMPVLDGDVVGHVTAEVSETERRIMASFRLVAALHANGIVCGDLCGSSFLVQRNGELSFIGVMGSFDSEASSTGALPPTEVLHYIAPEQRSGSGLGPASDVFALGVLGYYLLTRHYPFKVAEAGQTNTSVFPLKNYINNAPLWAEQVILKCLEPNPEARFNNAIAVVNAIAAIRQEAFTQSSVPAKIAGKSQSLVGSADQRQQDGVRTYSAPSSKATQPPPAQGSRFSDTGFKVIAVFFVALVAVLLVGRTVIRSRNSGNASLESELAAHRLVVGNEQLKQAIDIIAEGDSSLPERAAQLEKIVNSDDPVAHDILVKSAKGATSEQLRALSEKAIIDRARRLGLIRSAEQVRQWLRTIRGGPLPLSYEAVLKALDITLPIDATSAALRQAYASNPQMVLRLAVALALDTNKLEEFQPVLAQLIGDSQKMEDAKDYSTLALVLASSDLAVVFGDDVIQKRELLPDTDVLWLLKVLADRNDANVRAIANLALERSLLPPLRGTLLSTVRDRSDLPLDVLSALIRAAAGALRIEDISAFGRWYDADAEKILLAICGSTSDPQLLLEAFDTLAGKSLVSEPATSLVEWVRGANHWEQRGSLAHAVGVLSNVDLVKPEEVEQTIAAFDPFMKEARLIEILIATKNPVLVRTIIGKYSNNIGLAGLLGLLEDADRSVRIVAIKALKGYNDIGALKLIIDHYEKEKDPEVREVYRDTFWMIKQREGAPQT